MAHAPLQFGAKAPRIFRILEFGFSIAEASYFFAVMLSDCEASLVSSMEGEQRFFAFASE